MNENKIALSIVTLTTGAPYSFNVHRFISATPIGNGGSLLMLEGAPQGIFVREDNVAVLKSVFNPLVTWGAIEERLGTFQGAGMRAVG